MQLASPHPKPWLQSGAKILQHTLVVGLLVGLIVAGFGWYTSARTASDLALQGQSLSRINQFQDTGIAVDQAFAEFSDAARDKRALAASKLVLDRAVRLHASQADALRSSIGAEQADAYLDDLNSFRAAVDASTDATHLGDRLTAFSTMKVARDAAVISAKEKRI